MRLGLPAGWRKELTIKAFEVPLTTLLMVCCIPFPRPHLVLRPWQWGANDLPLCWTVSWNANGDSTPQMSPFGLSRTFYKPNSSGTFIRTVWNNIELNFWCVLTNFRLLLQSSCYGLSSFSFCINTLQKHLSCVPSNWMLFGISYPRLD